jgi:DNA-binding protein HU-beta
VPNKAQFIELLAQRLDGDKRRAAAALDAVIDGVYATISRGEKVAITGFGVFERRERAARTARNPATGASVSVPASRVPAFRPGAEFRAITNGTKEFVERRPASTSTARAGADTARETPARSTGAAKKAAAKKAAKKSAAKKSAAKKAAPAKKSAAKKSAAKKAAPAKKSGAKKAAAKKAAPAKKSAAKKAAAKKAAAKKATPAKKSAARKSAPTRGAAKKTGAKKAAKKASRKK